jgi:N-acetylglucosaminyltransferase
VLVVIFISLPIKTYAFFTMNKQGWLTRHADTIGGDGQGAGTLDAVDVDALVAGAVPASGAVHEPVQEPVQEPVHEPVHEPVGAGSGTSGRHSGAVSAGVIA